MGLTHARPNYAYTFQSESDKPFFRKEVQAHFTEWLEETVTEAPAEMEVVPTEAPALRRAKEALERGEELRAETQK